MVVFPLPDAGRRSRRPVVTGRLDSASVRICTVAAGVSVYRHGRSREKELTIDALRLAAGIHGGA